MKWETIDRLSELVTMSGGVEAVVHETDWAPAFRAAIYRSDGDRQYEIMLGYFFSLDEAQATVEDLL